MLLQHRSASSSRLSVKVNRIYLEHIPTRLNRDNRRPANIAFSVPFAVTPSTGILTRFPSTTPFGLARVDSPCRLTLDRNLGLPASGLFTRFIVTYVSIRTSDTSSMPHSTPSQAYRTLPYPTTHGVAAAASVHGLAPLHLPRRPTRPVSYYAFFK